MLDPQAERRMLSPISPCSLETICELSSVASIELCDASAVSALRSAMLHSVQLVCCWASGLAASLTFGEAPLSWLHYR